jgi:hypothetical protein
MWAELRNRRKTDDVVMRADVTNLSEGIQKGDDAREIAPYQH